MVLIAIEVASGSTARAVLPGRQSELHRLPRDRRGAAGRGRGLRHHLHAQYFDRRSEYTPRGRAFGGGATATILTSSSILVFAGLAVWQIASNGVISSWACSSRAARSSMLMMFVFLPWLFKTFDGYSPHLARPACTRASRRVRARWKEKVLMEKRKEAGCALAASLLAGALALPTAALGEPSMGRRARGGEGRGGVREGGRRRGGKGCT
ncbi:MAG: hypothetical protein ACLTMP_07735 [Eggerthella lenta]